MTRNNVLLSVSGIYVSPWPLKSDEDLWSGKEVTFRSLLLVFFLLKPMLVL